MGVLRLLGSGRLRPDVAPAAGVEASCAMERSLAMRWVRALGVTSVVGRGVSLLVGEGKGVEKRAGKRRMRACFFFRLWVMMRSCGGDDGKR